MKNILCFGDSNTHGYIAGGYGRYPFDVRWPGALQNMLGADYHIIEEGLNGRTVIFDDPLSGRKSLDYIGPCVRSHIPLDMIIFMVGSNDCKIIFRADAKKIASGMRRILRLARASCFECNPKFLLVSPPHLSCRIWREDFDETSEKTCRGLAAEYSKVSAETGSLFLDAAKVTEPGNVDYLHLDPDGHKKLAQAISKIIKKEA